MPYTYRTVKGSPLTHEEFDENFAYTESLWGATENAKESTLAMSNFKGAWDVQTGAASVPYAVLHNNDLWGLLADIPDVELDEPSEVSPNWFRLLRTESVTNVLLTYTGALADKQAFINATGTGIEWASGCTMMTFSRDMAAVTGDVSYTGLGFKPRLLLFFGGKPSTSTASFGLDDATAKYVLYTSDTGVFQVSESTVSISLYASTGGSQVAEVLSTDSDGFTLSWAKAGSPVGTAYVHCLAFR